MCAFILVIKKLAHSCTVTSIISLKLTQYCPNLKRKYSKDNHRQVHMYWQNNNTNTRHCRPFQSHLIKISRDHLTPILSRYHKTTLLPSHRNIKRLLYFHPIEISWDHFTPIPSHLSAHTVSRILITSF